MATTDDFQLPALSPINLSLTEGTDIPPPRDSPPQTPRPPTPGKGPLSSHPTSPLPTPPNANDGTGNKHSSDSAPSVSSPPTSPKPTIEKRPSSVRKFLGLRIGSSDNLHTAHNDHLSPTSPKRPGSPLAGTSNGSSQQLTRKKSGAWFGRRKSVLHVFGRVDSMDARLNGAVNGGKAEEEKKGPPAPTLPEFGKLGNELDGGRIGGDDLFQNIK